MPTVDVDLIARRLFDHPVASRRIRQDYAIEFSTPAQIASAIVRAFGQAPQGDAGDAAEVTNAAVYRAAVRALASNSRSWSVFLRNERRLEDLLGKYDPDFTADALRCQRLDVAVLRECLHGQTSTADVRAICAWASLLATDVNYYEGLASLRASLQREGARPEELMPMVAVHLGAPSSRMERRHPPPAPLTTWKVPGMGAVLASEFLRNLRWSGFKPDRHIKRLLGRWFPDVVHEKAVRARELAEGLEKKSREVIEFLTYALVGCAVTPPGRSLTEVDNLVWALGAYVEKRGKEFRRLVPAGVKLRSVSRGTSEGVLR